MNTNDVWYRHIWGSDGGEGRDYDLHEWDSQYFGRSYCIHLQGVSDLKMTVAMSSGILVALGWTTRRPSRNCYVPLVVKFLHFTS